MNNTPQLNEEEREHKTGGTPCWCNPTVIKVHDNWPTRFLNEGTRLLGIDCSALISVVSSELLRTKQETWKEAVKKVSEYNFEFLFHVDDKEEAKDAAINGAQWAKSQIMHLLSPSQPSQTKDTN